MLLHQGEVFFDLFHTDGESGNRVRVVTVDSAKFNFFSVKEKYTVADFDCTECKFVDDRFIFRLKYDRVEVGVLCVPEDRIFKLKLYLSRLRDRLFCEECAMNITRKLLIRKGL